MSEIGEGLQVCLSWIRDSKGNVPKHAIKAADDLYIIRAKMANDLVVGKAKPKNGTGYIPYDGKEVQVADYEVLCDTSFDSYDSGIVWMNGSNGGVPPKAVAGGITVSKEPLYVARAEVNGEMCVGKVHSSQKCAYMPCGYREHIKYDYEVLCFK